LREAHSVRFQADDGVLGIVADLDPNAFIQLLSTFDNPYPLPSALQAARAEWSFSHWKTLLLIAPAAFNDDGSWNGSAIVPLLLVIARERALEAQHGVGPDANEARLKEAADEIEQLAGEIAETIAARSDAGPCAERWAVWLMRQCLAGLTNEAQPFPSNARSGGYVDAVLVGALGRAVGARQWGRAPAPDAEPWEDWCHRCVIVSLAANGLTPMPAAERFLDQWRLSPEDWTGQRGQALRERASLFDTFGRRADAYGTRLLATPLAEANEPLRVWQDLWYATQTIRDIVEFGDPDTQADGSIGTEYTAGELMRLVFGLGLMMLDW
jgi:hypothetical protein